MARRLDIDQVPNNLKELLMQPTIVLVHGAFAESASLEGVIDRLVTGGIV
jgi:hypothetical protein